jgi:serine/threonine protein kinase
MVKVFDDHPKSLLEREKFIEFLKSTGAMNFDPACLGSVTKINKHVFRANATISGFDKTYIVKSFKINKNTCFRPNSNINLRLLKEFIFAHKTKNNPYTQKLIGYYDLAHKFNTNFYIIYKYYRITLEQLMKENSVDFVHRIRVMKMLIEVVRDIHINGLICLDLKPRNIKFSKRNVLKLTSKNVCDINSLYDVDGLFTVKSDLDIYTAPEVFLGHGKNVYWHSDIWSLGVIISNLFSIKIYRNETKLFDYFANDRVPKGLFKSIDNLFIQSMVIGMLKVTAFERPNIFQVIDCYNKLIDMLGEECEELNRDYYINYDKQDFLSKNCINF